MVTGRLTFATILASVPTLDGKEIGRQTKQVTLEKGGAQALSYTGGALARVPVWMGQKGSKDGDGVQTGVI